jgi:hypothetical protein
MSKEIDALSILEGKIIQLVEAFASMKTEKTTMAGDLLQKEQELKELRERVMVFSEEREIALKKVENLLNRIERIVPLSQKE